MASVDFIQKRIAGKEKEVERLEKKLARIRKAEASGWKDNPYYYDELDLRWAQRDLEAAQQGLERYQAELKAALEKANSRNVPAILEFLEMWKQRCTEFYGGGLNSYFSEKQHVRSLYCALSDTAYKSPEYEAAKAAYEEANRKYDFIIERTNAIVGEITDASGLSIGNKQDLNGFIVGTRGTAKVQTIGAGGYNIQCFHFRTLINRI